jgi:hypothetical protein
MPLGPKRAPGRYEVPVSKGAPNLVRLRSAMYLTNPTNEGNVVFGVGGQARAVRKAAECGDARKY